MALPRPARRCRRDLPRLLSEPLEPRLLLAMDLPPGFTESLVAQNLSSPTAMAFTPDGRLFVTQQNGVIRVIKDNQLLPDPFITLANVDSSSERGLMGITFDPDFDANHYVYLYYTSSLGTRHNRITRLTVSGDQAVPGSETLIVQLPNVPDSGIWHMGGSLTFGPDDKLHVTVGDYVNSANAQNMNVVMGKALRFNADGSIPTDNPFYNTTTGLNRSIWALGLRNPFTAAWQPGTNNYYIADVGQSAFEEINAGSPGANFGWPTTEGTFNPATYPNFTNPVHAYGRSEGCAVIGGAFYNPNVYTFPTEYHGKFMFMDFCNGWIHTLDPVTQVIAEFGSGASFPTGLSVNPVDGTVWYLSRGGQTGGHQPGLGKVFRIENTSTAPAQILLQPESQTIPIGEDVTFTASATGTPPISYQWRRNGAIIPGATSSSYTLSNVQLADSGDEFTVTVTNAFGSDVSDPAVLTVTTNTRPNPAITLPDPGTLFIGGQTINFAGTASDPEDGPLPASAFTWQIDFHHDEHVHPFYPATSGMTSGSFQVATSGHTEHTVWYRIYLTVRDSQGLTRTTFRDIFPQTAHITLQTNIPGLTLNLDGQPRTTPLTVQGVVNINRVLEAPALQFFNGVNYEFVSWSHGGNRIQTIPFPSTDTTYIANYQPSTAIFLSDLTFATTPVNGWGPVEKDRSNGEQGPADGNPITLNGVNYAKGLGVHAASSITYNLNGQYTRFLSDIGVDDEVGGNGSVVFQVFADNVKIFDSGTVTGSSTTQTIDVPVNGVNQLRLVVTNGGDNINFDHADWASARLLSNNIPYARINFTAADGEEYVPYLKDTGLIFGNRGNGLSYGWLQDNTAATRDRDSAASPDERYDSFNHLQKPEYPDAVWEIAVPNGTYLVRIVAGESDFFDSTYHLTAEGVTVVNGTPTTTNRWVEGTAQVTVNDGRITVRSGAGTVNNKIAFIDILTVPSPLVINGTAGDDNVHLALSPDGKDIRVWHNVPFTGPPSFTRGLLGTTTVTVNAGNGPNVLTLDLANGNPLAGGLTYIGGNSNDTLRVLGSSAADNIIYDATTLSINGKLLSFTGVDLADLQLLAGDDVLTVTASTPRFDFIGGAGSDTLHVSGGAHNLISNALLATYEHLAISGNAQVSSGVSQTLSSLTLSDNARAVLTTGGDKILETSGLIRSGQSVLDLMDNRLILHTNFPAARDLALATIESAIRSARGAAGAWAGPGITSSTAASTPFTTLATTANIIRPGSLTPLFTRFGGVNVTANDVLVRLSPDGDANLDGKLNIADYLRIDRGFARGLSGFANGDFDYSGGAPDGTDYFLIDQAFSQSTPLASPTAPTPAAPVLPMWSSTLIRDANPDDETPDLLLASKTAVF